MRKCRRELGHAQHAVFIERILYLQGEPVPSTEQKAPKRGESLRGPFQLRSEGRKTTAIAFLHQAFQEGGGRW